MSSNLFEKILKIVQVVVTLLEMAVKAFTGIGDDDDDDDVPVDKSAGNDD